MISFASIFKPGAMFIELAQLTKSFTSDGPRRTGEGAPDSRPIADGDQPVKGASSGFENDFTPLKDTLTPAKPEAARPGACSGKSRPELVLTPTAPSVPDAAIVPKASGAEEQRSFDPEGAPISLDDYRVPTFADGQGWFWMLPMCVSRYVLLSSLAQRTETPGQDGGPFEAHAMAMLYDSAVYLWCRDNGGRVCSHVVGPKIAAVCERKHPDQHIFFADNRWAIYDPKDRKVFPVQSPPVDSLYVALLQGYTGCQPTPDEVMVHRRVLAASMRAECNRESFAAKALNETHRRLDMFTDAHPGLTQGLKRELGAFWPALPPMFMWDGQTWPHPACAAAYDLMQCLVGPMRRMGTWGSELEAEAVAHAKRWRVHMWKPQEVPGSTSWLGRETAYERVVVYGPKDGAPVHVVNIIDNKHFAQFVPASDAWQETSTETLRLGGKVIDCGAGGNCLYHAMLGPGSTQDDVFSLRAKMVKYISARPAQYEDIASEAADIRWNDFLASRPEEAAEISKHAETYCARQLAANRSPKACS